MNLTNNLEQKLKEINAILTSRFLENQDIGVLAGISGVSLFHFYYARLFGDEKNIEVGAEILNQIIERINNGYSVPTFCSGIAGAAWVMDHLVEKEFIDLDLDELLQNLDPYLFSVMQSDMKSGNYDFLHSGIGYGLYFYKRFCNTKNKTLKKQYKKYLLSIVSDLNKIAHSDYNGYRWESNLEGDSNIKGYNLSLSHGMSSIIIFLTRLNSSKEFKDITEPMLRGSIKYIQSQRLKEQKPYCLYPDKIPFPKNEKIRTRLGWCYGDLGIALAFFKAGKSLKNERLINESLEIAKFCTQRRSIEETKVIDAELCHGAFGNAIIFNYFFNMTNLDLFKETTDYWMDYGLKLAIHNDGNAGYKHWSGSSQQWMAKLSVLEGVSGIGLAIINYLSGHENNWDECLLIS